jgi:hypothetical protein
MSSDTSLVFNLVTRERASEGLAKMKEKFGAASAGIGAALGVGIGASIAASMDMEAANDKLAAQLGVGPVEAAKLAKVSAHVYSNAWGESTADVNDAIKGVYQNIGDTSAATGGLEGVTTKVIALRDTFDQDLGGVTAAVGQMMKTGLAANADEAMDIITAGFQKGANKADDFLDTLNEYGTQFRKVGIDGQMATGLISQGLKAGARDGDIVADSIKEFSIRAIDGSKTTAAGFQSIGLNAGDMAAKIGKGGQSATDALDLTLDKLRGIKDPVQQAAVATELFGTQAEDMGAALYALDPSSAVQALGKVGGAADRMAKTVGDNPKAALEGFKRSALMATTQIAGHFVAFAMKNQQVFKPLAAVLAGVAAAILLVQVGTVVWTAATTAWTVAQSIATAAQWAYNAALAANPIVLIIIAVIALIAVIVLIATKTTWFQTAWKAMTAAVSIAWNWVVDMVKKGVDFLIMIFLNFTLVGLIINHWNSIKRGAITAWNATIDFIKAIPGRLVQLFLNFTLPGLIIKHWSSIKNGTIRIATATVNWVKGLPGRFISAVSSLATRLYTAGAGAWNRFKTANITVASQTVAWARGLPGRIVAAVGNLGSRLYNAGRALLMGFWNGIKSYASTLGNNVSGIVGKVRDYFPFSPAKKGPFSGSGYTTYSGQKLVTDFAKGITSRASTATAAMTGVVAGVSGAGTQSITTAPLTGAAPMRRSAQVVRVVVDVTGGDSELKKVVRKWVRVDGGGNVQRAFGK